MRPTAEIPLTLETTRVNFARYRLDLTDGRAAALSFVNTSKVILATVGIGRRG